jgi:hypothetical protein
VDRAVAAVVLLAACGVEPTGQQLADGVVSAVASDGPFGDPELAVNGVRGGGTFSGSLDVFSLGPADVLVLSFAEPVADGPGPDLAVFENPFDVDGGGRFFDPVVVSVSADCLDFVDFPFSYDGGPWTADPGPWHGVAGLTPVELHEEDNPVDPLSEAAGGDRFDLADLAQPAPAEVRCVRLGSTSAYTDEDGLPYPADPASNGPDIDGVYGRTAD